jgi:hypothetical protein
VPTNKADGAMMSNKKSVTMISDKLVKINESFTVNMYDNGFMFEITGRNKKSDYVTAKIMCSDLDQVITLMREAVLMERDE